MHLVESKLVGLELFAHGILNWRSRIEPIIEDLREADRIAEGVADRLSKQHKQELTEGSYRLTRWQIRLGVGGLVVAAVSLGLSTLHQIGWL